MKEIANLPGSRGTLLEHSPVADSQLNGFVECGNQVSCGDDKSASS